MPSPFLKFKLVMTFDGYAKSFRLPATDCGRTYLNFFYLCLITLYLKSLSSNLNFPSGTFHQKTK